MSTALTLVVLIVAGDANDPTVTAMTRAAREALGRGAQVVVREVPKDISDDDAVAVGHSLHADSVVEITWKDAAHLHARMHMHSEMRARWIDREISFDASDADSERGRTLGFTVASMLPENSGAPSDDERASAPSAATPSSTAPPTTSPSPLTASAPAQSRDTAPSSDAAAVSHRWSAAVDLAASGGLGIGGDASGIGGALAGQWYLGPRFALRLGGAVRRGDVAEAQAASLEIAVGPGVAWRSHTPSLAYPLGFSLRADLLVVRHALTRSGDASRPARWVPAADLMLDVSWLLAEHTAIFAALGPEMAFGATDVVVRGERVATIPLLRGVAELGLRVRF